MRILAAVFGTVLFLLGLVFCAAASATGLWQRWVLGGVLCASGVVVWRLGCMRCGSMTVEHRVEFPGESRLKELTCEQCGGSLTAKNMRLEAGAVFVSCPYCSAEYQIEEAPKW
jgi:hypothetical protein